MLKCRSIWVRSLFLSASSQIVLRLRRLDDRQVDVPFPRVEVDADERDGAFAADPLVGIAAVADLPFLKACKVDIDREFETAEELYKFGFASAKGKTIVIDMGVRVYNGTEYNNVTDFLPLPDSTVSVDDVAESFGVTPEVKNNTLDGMVSEEANTPEETEEVPGTDEPELDIDLSDADLPF